MPDLPIGTVTFLFTDIEGSTHLLQELGEGYRAVQDRHAQLVREAIGAEGGHEVRTEGDSFFATFPTPAGAVRAAVAAQRSLTAERWPHGGHLRVRMGLHTGEGVPGGDDYVGIDVNRAARIAAAGHGGQVLLSGATRGLVERALPPGVTLRDLGTHRLKDIEHPEQLHDLVIDGLPADFPPIRTLDARRTNLPAERTSFVGRERERAHIAELLGTTRLLTLTGPGGTGKTRLALKVAGDQVGRFRDGVYLVDLSAVTNPAVVPSKIATTLGIREDPATDLERTLAEHLRDREALLLLDNMEQVIDAATIVDRLLATAPGFRILATSRVPLRLSGEYEYDLEPLPLPDPERAVELEQLATCESVMLFVERAGAVRRAFRLTDENAAAITRIVERVDGLPLAVELAASRVKVLTPQVLMHRLDQRLPLLTGGARDLPERHRTLRGTIAWSHDLLDAEEQRLFARLSVFAGGCSLESAEAVCGPELNVAPIDGLGSLVDNSLLKREESRDGSVRFRMLETIREFAAERLEESNEADEIRRRHAWDVVTTAEDAEPELLVKDRSRLDRLEEEHDNIRAALRWSVESGEPEAGLRIVGALWRFWQVRSHLAEGRRWTEEVLALPSASARTGARAKALAAKGSLAYWLQESGSVRGPYEESLAIYRELEDRRGEAEAAYNLSFAQLLAKDLPGAKALQQRAVDIYRALDEPVRLAHANTALAMVAFQEGDLETTQELIEEARRTFLRVRDLWGLAMTSGVLGTVALQRGDYRRGREVARQSLEVFEEMGSPGASAVAMQAFAVVAIYEGRLERGIRLAGAVERLKEVAGGEAPSAIVGLEDPLELVKGRLPQERIDALRDEGRAMSVEEAVAYGKGEA